MFFSSGDSSSGFGDGWVDARPAKSRGCLPSEVVSHAFAQVFRCVKDASMFEPSRRAEESEARWSKVQMRRAVFA